MAKLPSTNQTEVAIFRLSPKLKQTLNELAKKSKYGGGGASAVIRALIENESKR